MSQPLAGIKGEQLRSRQFRSAEVKTEYERITEDQKCGEP
jgi:hypothetical protein